MNATKSFGQYLKSRREKAELSQRQVSEKLGYTTPQFVSNWERGIISPPIETLKTLCTMYKMQQTDVKKQWMEIQEEKWK